MARRQHPEYKEPLRIPLPLQITIVVLLAVGVIALVVAAVMHAR